MSKSAPWWWSVISGWSRAQDQGWRSPSWLPDPTDRHVSRFWDGDQWTARVADDESETIDPLVDDFPDGMEGRFHRAAAWMLGVMALFFVVVAGFAVGRADGPDWLAGAVPFLCAGLLVVWSIRLRRIRYLDIDPDGVTVHTTWRDRSIVWDEVDDVELFTRTTAGLTQYVPTILFAHQRPCVIYGFIEPSSTRDWADEALRALLHARAHYAPVRDAV